MAVLPVLRAALLVSLLPLFLSYPVHGFFIWFLGDSEANRRYNPSVDSHSSMPSMSPFADPGTGSSEPYPAWTADRQIPMSTEEIEDIFLDLTQKFGFQRDSMRNMASALSSLVCSV